MSNLPFHETITEGYHVRVFNESTDSDELVWHRDREDRIVVCDHPTDWRFQMDNSLPIGLTEPVFVPKETYHRLVKGTGELTVRVKKL
jgi:hypothetical protein